MRQPTVLLAGYPFGACDPRPLAMLKAAGCRLVPNPYRRRLKAGEVNELLQGVDVVIAGTEPYTAETLSRADQLKAICRIGIGLDNIDLPCCHRKGIIVTYTPDAPSDAVAELTIANILNLLRHIHESDHSIREGAWNRLMGRLIREITVGIVGVGRIGSRVINLLQPFQPEILATDTNPEIYGRPLSRVTWCEADVLFSQADIITLHIPMNTSTRHFVDRRRISLMKTGAMLINSSRGAVVDEAALVDALVQGHLGGAAIDTFVKEPYEGPLTRMDNCVLTAHIGASANESRIKMELGATEDCLRIIHGQTPFQPAPIED